MRLRGDYIYNISWGLTKFATPDDGDQYLEVNYLILQACHYWNNAEGRHKWKAPLLYQLESDGQVTTTGLPIAARAEGMIDYETCVRNFLQMGTTLTGMSTMDFVWEHVKNYKYEKGKTALQYAIQGQIQLLREKKTPRTSSRL